MIIISIDPGLRHTGVVMFRFYENKLLGSFFATLREPNLYNLLNKMARFSKEIVIERMPLNLQYPLSEIVSKINGSFQNMQVTFISPATWKPISKAQGWYDPNAKTQHEQDAFCMLQYYLMFYKGKFRNENYT